MKKKCSSGRLISSDLQIGRYQKVQWALFFIILMLLSAIFWPPEALAVGTLISAPGRVDMVYDDARGILYITDGGSVLRYRLTSNSFLSPFALGGHLKGIDLSPDGNTLIVADQSYSSTHVWVHEVDLTTGQNKKVNFSRAFYEGGTFTVAFGNDSKVLITSRFLGSGWVPLRKYDPGTGQVSTLTSVRQDTMLRASADGSAIGFAESNSSGGPFGRYRVADGNIRRNGTSWFNYEIAVNRNGTQYAIPTYGGTFITDVNLVKYDKVGAYAGGQPIGVAYHPIDDVVYFAWATTPKIYAYDTSSMTKITEYDFQSTFGHPGNHAFVNGRLKTSRDGNALFATVGGGVRYLLFSPIPLKTTVNSNPSVADGANGWFKTNPEITFTANNTATTYYSWDSTASFTTFSASFYPPSLDQHTLYYFSANASDGTESVKNRTFRTDAEDAVDPIITSLSHTIGVESYNNNVDIGLSGATDSVSGVDGYSISWSQDTTEVPDTTKDLEENETGTTSAMLANGLWYFNLRTVDNAGNWTNTAHLGPFDLNGNASKTQLTFSSNDEWISDFSPDGGKIVYTVENASTFESDVWLMNSDGSSKTNLTNTPGQDEWSPSFNNDGTKITYSVMDTNTAFEDVWLMNSDGSSKTNLTNTPVQDEWSPSFNQDGTRILYSVVDADTWYEDIWVMNANGTGKTNLTNTPDQDEWSQSFNQDGTRILYSVVDADTWYEDIWAMNANGTGKTNLTNTPDQDEWSPMFDPGRSKIAYTVIDPDTDDSDVWMMNTDGSGKENLTKNPDRDEYSPVFSPTEAGFAFQADSAGGDTNIWLYSFFDVELPIDPIVLSSSHTTGSPSADNTIEIGISGATDTLSGVDGFSVSWSQGAPEMPDTTKDLEETENTTTSPPLADGNWFFNLRTKDNAGNWTSTVHLGPFIIDTPPTTVINTEPSVPDGNNGWFTVDPTITLIADDIEAETFYSWDGTSSVTTYTAPFQMPAQGEHAVYFYSIDSFDNTETVKSQSFKLDKTAPQTQADATGTEGQNGWYTSDVTVTLTATDNTGGSGVALAQYSFDNANWTNYSSAMTIAAEGISTIYYRSTDSAGNVEANKELVVKIDKTASQTNADLTGAEGQNGWYTSDVEVAWEATDNIGGSGVALTQYNFNNTTWSNYDIATTITTTEGVTTIYYRSTDNAGNVEATSEMVVKIDKTAPIDPVVLSSSHTTGSPSADNTIEIGISGATDALSGVDGFSVSWSRGATETPDTIKDLEETETLTISPPLGDGTWYFNLRTKDNAGNWTSTVHLGPFIIDTGAPTTAISTEPSAPNGDNGWFTVDPTITLIPDDDGAETFYSWDGTSSVTTYTAPFQMIAEGRHTVYFYSIDSFDNTEAVGSQSFKLDKTAPQTVADSTGTEGQNGWYISDVSATLTATDNAGGSGVALTQYSFDSTNWTNYSSAMTITAEGMNTIYYRSTDSAGNVEANKELVVKIDSSAPQTVADTTGTEGENGWYTSDVEVALQATDGNDAAIIEDFEDGNADGWTLSGRTLPKTSADADFLIDGNYSLMVKGHSYLKGHHEVDTHDGVAYRDFIVPDESTLTLKTKTDIGYPYSDHIRVTLYDLDNDSSVIKQWDTGYKQGGLAGGAYGHDMGLTENSIDLSEYAGKNIRLYMRSHDGGWFADGSIDSISFSTRPSDTQYSFDNTTWNNYESTMTITAEGTTTIYYRSTDNAGNVEATSEMVVKIDKTAPIDPVVLSSSHTTGSPSADNTIEIGISGATDALSGVDGFSVSWSQGATETPNTTKDLEETETSTTSPPLADGNWYFNLRTKDNAGNWTSTIHVGPYEIDTVDPSGTIEIKPTGGFGQYTNRSGAKLKLTAADGEGVVVISMRFKNEGGVWSKWLVFSTSAQWSLSAGDGTKRVWAQFKDAAGNISTPVSDTVFLDTVKPSLVLLKVPRISSNVSKTKAFKIRWSTARDPSPSSGVNYYELQHKISGKKWKNGPWFTGATETSFVGKPGKTYYFRVKIKDTAGNTRLTRAKKTIVPFDNNHQLRRISGFTRSSRKKKSDFYLGTISLSSRAGQFITYRFTGRSVALISTKAPNRSKAKIYVDGKYKKTIDAYSPYKKRRRVVFSVKWRKRARHSIKIVNLATPGRRYFDVDALAVGR